MKNRNHLKVFFAGALALVGLGLSILPNIKELNIFSGNNQIERLTDHDRLNAEHGYSVTYDPNGAENYGGNLPIDETSYNAGDSVTVSTDTISREGYVFYGWSSSKDGLPETTVTVSTKDITLYALWGVEISFHDDCQLYYYGTSDEYSADAIITNAVKIVVYNENISKSFTFEDHISCDSIEVNLNLIDFPPEYGYTALNPSKVYLVDFANLLGDCFVTLDELIYNIVYDGNGATSGDVPEDYNDYSNGDVVTLETQNDLINGTKLFRGWATSSTATTPLSSYNIDYKDATNAIITLYAVWVDVITEQPSSSNNYTVTVNPNVSGDISYQWYEYKGKSLEKYYGEETKPYSSVQKIGGHEYYYAVESYLYVCFTYEFDLSKIPVGTSFTFTYDGSNPLTFRNISATVEDGVYKCTILEGSLGTTAIFYNTPNASPLPSPIYLGDFIVDTDSRMIGGETNKTLSTNVTFNDAEYYCVVKSDGIKIAESNRLTPNCVSFIGGTGATGTVKNIYQLENRNFTMPNNGFSKAKSTFIGWNTSSTAKGASEKAGDSYLMGNTDLTFYAVWQGDVEYIKATGDQTTCDSSAYTRIDNTMTTIHAGWYALDEDVTFSGAITIDGDVKIILCDGCTLTCAGVVVDTSDSLTIFGQANHTGMLNSTAVGDAPGIGCDHDLNGDITINGGTINATGSGDGDGIGATPIIGSKVTINGGIVNATGGPNGSGIGGGCNSSAGVFITGGTVTAIGGDNGGVGTSLSAIGSNVSITGGSVTAIGGAGGCGIGYQIYSISNITVGLDRLVKAGTTSNPTTIISHSTASTDIANSISGKQYVTIVDKLDVVIDKTVQTFTYDGSTHSFSIIGSLTTGFTVEYNGGSSWSTSLPKNAGYYDVRITRAMDDEYNAFSVTMFDKLVIDRAEISISANTNNNKTYNGNNISLDEVCSAFTITGLVGGDTVKSAFEGGDSFEVYVQVPSDYPDAVCLSVEDELYVADFTVVNTKDVGSYNILLGVEFINYKLRIGGNYETGYQILDLGFNVTPKEVVLEWISSSFFYNGNSQVKSCNVASTSLFGTDTCSVTVTGAQIEVGDYIATAASLSNPNYKLPSVTTSNFAIQKGYATDLTNEEINVTYDGTDHANAATVKTVINIKGINNSAITPTKISFSFDGTNYVDETDPGFSWDNLVAKNAGTYNIYYKYEFTNYITCNGFIELKVAQKEIELVWGETELVYNGTIRVPTCSAKPSSIIEGDTVSIRINERNVNVGTGYVATANIMNLNYKLPAEHSILYSIIKGNATNRTEDVSVTYNGTDYANSSTVSSAIKIYGRGTTLVTPTNKYFSTDGINFINETDPTFSWDNIVAKNAGVYTIYYKYEFANYNTITDSFNLTIDKKEVQLEWSTPNIFAYDGYPHGITATVNPSSIVDGDTCYVVSVSDSEIDVGTYIIVANELSNPNYRFPAIRVSVIQITRIDATDVTENIEVTYDGTDYANSNAVKGNIDIRGIGGLSITPSAIYFSTDGESYLDETDPDFSWDDIIAKDAGVYTIYYKYEFANYNTVTGSFDLTINQKEIELVWGNTELTYNGNPQRPTVSIKASSLVGNDACGLSITGDEIEVGNNYTVTVTDLNNINYKLPTVVSKSFSIGKANASIDVTNVVKTYTYNGQEITINSGAFLSHTESNLTYSNNKFTNAGSYVVTISAPESSHYKATSINVNITVNKAATVINVNDTPIVKVYDGIGVTVPSATCTNGTVSVNKTSEDLVHAGNYVITYSVAGNANYESATKTVNVTINPAFNLITNVVINNVTCGEKVTASAESLFGEVAYYYNPINSDAWIELTDTNYPTAIGTYNYKVEVVGTDDYSYASVIGTFTVSSKEIETKENSEDETFISSKSELIEGKLDDDVKVVIEKEEKVNNKSLKENIKNAISSKSAIVSNFDIHLENNDGVKVENVIGNRYRITLSIPNELIEKSGFAIVLFDEDNNVIVVNADRIDENTFVFEMDRLCKCAIVADETTTWIIPTAISCALAIGLLIFFLLPRKIKFIIDGEVVEEKTYRPFAKLSISDKWFIDESLTEKFIAPKMGIKSIKVYGKKEKK